MNKVKLVYFLFASLLLSLKVANSQVFCLPNRIHGDWYYIDTFHPVNKLNVDSIKNTVKDSLQYRYKVSFLRNGNRITQLTNGKNQLIVYRVDSLNCNIIYGKRKKPRYYEVSKIEYLDENCLFLTTWNPHGPWTIFYHRK